MIDLADLPGLSPALRVRRHPWPGRDRLGTSLLTGLTIPDRSRKTANYPADIPTFCEEVLGVRLWEKQLDIAHAVDHYRRTAVKSCHGSGKTYAVAAIAVAFLHVYEHSRVITTGPSGGQIKSAIWQYIRQIADNARRPLLGRPLTTQWEIGPNWLMEGIKPAKQRAGVIQGRHAEHILLLVDEAAETEPEIQSALDSLLTSETARLLLIGNPTSVVGPFYVAFTKDASLWHRITITAADTPNIQAQRRVIPGLVEQVWIDEQTAKHGADSDYIRARVHAEFPLNEGGTYVPLAWIDACRQDARPPAVVPWEAGLDVARYGGDKNVLTIRAGEFVWQSIPWTGLNTMETAGRVQAEIVGLRDRITAHYPHRLDLATVPLNRIKVDVTGIGSGVADRLREVANAGEFRCGEVIDVNFGGKPNDPEKFLNVTDESWWTLRESFRLNAIRGAIEDDFVEEVTSRGFQYPSNRPMPHMEQKDDFKKRLGRSPDFADSYALAFWTPGVGLPVNVGGVVGKARFGEYAGRTVPDDLNGHGDASYGPQSDDGGQAWWPTR